MAAFVSQREPDMDHFKYDQQMSRQIDSYGGGTSLPLNSDGYEDRQRVLRDERHQDFLQQQAKSPDHSYSVRHNHSNQLAHGPQHGGDYDHEIQKMTDRYHNKYDNVLFTADEPRSAAYYSISSPEEGLRGIGNYQNEREKRNLERQKDYNEMMKKQRRREKQMEETRRHTQSYPAQPKGPQMDYNVSQEQANMETRRGYQDYLGKFQYPLDNHPKPVMNYEENQKYLAEERKRDYNMLREKKEKEAKELALRGRPVTPPGGLNIGQYDRQLKQDAAQKKKEYKQMLDKQKREQLKYRAWDQIADQSPLHINYRDGERPLVGSPKDVNNYMREKESKDIFRKDLKAKPQRDSSSPSKNQYTAIGPFEDLTKKSYIEIERERVENQRKYRNELLKQQQEHMFLRARQEPEMSVFNRNNVGGPQPQQSQYLASKPPAGPSSRQRDEQARETPNYWNEGRPARSPLSLESESSRHGNKRANENPEFPLALHRRLPERPSYGQPPYPGKHNLIDNNLQLSLEKASRSQSPRLPRPQTPEKRGLRPVDLEASKLWPVENNDIPLAFRTEPYTQTIPSGQPLYPGESQPPGQPQNDKPYERERRSPPPQRTPPNRARRSPPPLEPQRGYSPSRPDDQSSPRRIQKSLIAENDDYGIAGRRREAGIQRKQEYNEYLKNKAEDDRRKAEAHHTAGEPVKITTDPYYNSDSYEHHQSRLRNEEREKYREHLQKQYEPSPRAQGLPIGQYKYEPKRLALEAERNTDYNELLSKQSPRTKASEGPQGLNIDVSFQDRKKAWMEKQRNKEYNDLLKKQETARSTQSNSQFNGDSYQPRPLSGDQPNPDLIHQQMTAPYPKSSSLPSRSRPATPGQTSLPVGQYDLMRPYFEKERNREYNSLKEKFLSPKKRGTSPALPNVLPGVGSYDDHRPGFEHERNREYNELLKTLPASKNRGMTPNATSMTLPVGQYDMLRPSFEEERNAEYNKLLAEGLGKKTFHKRTPTPPSKQGLPIGQQYYEPMYRAMEQQKNKEYNEHLKKKYVTSRSEPPGKASIYYGNDSIHDENRRLLETQRHREYNQWLKEQSPARNRSMPITSDVDSGLPIGQKHHESWKHFLRTERNQEYNQLQDMLNQDQSKSRRDWNFDQTGALELHGDDDVQSKKKELRAERIKDYNIYKHQMKAPPNHSWPAPDGRGALLVKKGEYEGVREMFREQRKQEFLKSLETQPQIENVMPLPRAVSEPAKVRPAYTNPMVESMGRYEEQQRRFVQDRRKDFRKFIDQLKPEDRYGRRNSESLPSIAGEEKPLVNNMGHYEMETKKKIREQRRKDFTDYNQIQKASPRNTVKENLMPHVASAETPLVDHMGHYTIENQMKLREERNRELRMFSEKKKQELRSPYDNYVFPMVAVAEKPVVDYLGLGLEQRKSELKEERKRDYLRYQTEQKQKELPRRHDYIDTAKGPYNGVFNGLGDYGKGKEILKRERKEEYNERLARDYAEHDRPSGRPNWAKETIPNNTDRGRSPMRNAGGGQQPGDDYSQRLDQKRVAERNMRRYNDPDPEYSGRHNEPEYQGRY